VTAAGPLAGLRVLELASERCAFAGKLLADMGADVVLVEPPGGDPMRRHPPFAGDVPAPDRSLSFWHHHTSKRGMRLDLARPEGAALFRRLAAGADLVLEAEPPRRLPELGLAPEELCAAHPALIWISVTPFGRSAPRADEQATDLTLLAGGGPAWSCGYDDHALPPIRGGGNQGYQIAGHYAVLSALTALLHRIATGEGQLVDVNMHAAANVTTEMASYHWLVQRGTVQRQTGRHAMEQPTLPTQIQCADGRWATTGVPPRTPREYRNVYDWIVELGLEPDFPEAVFLKLGAERESIDLSKIGQDEEVTVIFGAGREALNFIASRVSAYDFFVGAQQRGISVGVIYSPEEALEDPHFRARGFPVEVPHPELGRSHTYPGAPYRFEKSPWRISRRAPLLGEHEEEVLAEIGLDADAIAKLRADGVL
jgi:crotonobetainyl-CoA:carnitine CoA-transferase CaiB-like acyl-CoA transferase